MLDTSEKEKIIPILQEFLKQSFGIAFCLVMRHKDGSLELFKRDSQPCWGELRKYASTHGKECTKPLDKRPSDLDYPFPKGIPEALACNFFTYPQGQNFIDYLWSNKSPWVRGFGRKRDVIRNEHGVILLNTDIDPTIFVSLLKNSQRNPQTGILFNILVGAGLTPIQAIFPCVFTGLNQIYPGIIKIPPPDTYTNSVSVDIERVFNQDPLDLTGGTLRNRYDYERKDLAKIFHSKDGVNFAKELNGLIKWHQEVPPYKGIDFNQGWKGIKIETIVSGTLKILRDYFITKMKTENIPITVRTNYELQHRM